MSPDQIKRIHVYKGKAKLSDPQYRMLLVNVAGVVTCKDLTNRGFEDVMAVLEDHIEQAGDKKIGSYWRDGVARRAQFADPRQIWLITKLYQDIQESEGPDDTHYELAGLVWRMSGERTRNVRDLKPREAWQLTEALKKILKRMGDQSPAPVVQEDTIPI